MGCQGFEIFENYSDSLDIMESQQFDKFTNKTSTQSHKSNNRRLSAERSQRESHSIANEEEFDAIGNENAQDVLIDD